MNNTFLGLKLYTNNVEQREKKEKEKWQKITTHKQFGECFLWSLLKLRRWCHTFNMHGNRLNGFLFHSYIFFYDIFIVLWDR